MKIVAIIGSIILLSSLRSIGMDPSTADGERTPLVSFAEINTQPKDQAPLISVTSDYGATQQTYSFFDDATYNDIMMAHLGDLQGCIQDWQSLRASVCRMTESATCAQDIHDKSTWLLDMLPADKRAVLQQWIQEQTQLHHLCTPAERARLRVSRCKNGTVAVPAYVASLGAIGAYLWLMIASGNPYDPSHLLQGGARLGTGLALFFGGVGSLFGNSYIVGRTENRHKQLEQLDGFQQLLNQFQDYKPDIDAKKKALAQQFEQYLSKENLTAEQLDDVVQLPRGFRQSWQEQRQKQHGMWQRLIDEIGNGANRYKKSGDERDYRRVENKLTYLQQKNEMHCLQCVKDSDWTKSFSQSTLDAVTDKIFRLKIKTGVSGACAALAQAGAQTVNGSAEKWGMSLGLRLGITLPLFAASVFSSYTTGRFAVNLHQKTKRLQRRLKLKTLCEQYCGAQSTKND